MGSREFGLWNPFSKPSLSSNHDRSYAGEVVLAAAIWLFAALIIILEHTGSIIGHNVLFNLVIVRNLCLKF